MSPRPGEISFAHHGVLFLDELPEYDRRVLESLREPLETGCVTIARASRTLTFPAAFQLVAAMNPCPCGWLGHPQRHCACTPDRLERYRHRLSGPLLDRIDLQIALPPVNVAWIDAGPGETSELVRLRVENARRLQWQRQGGLNAALQGEALDHHCRLDAAGRALLTAAMQRWHWSARSVHRVLRVARTLADMSAMPRIETNQMAEAIQYHQPWGSAAVADRQAQP